MNMKLGLINYEGSCLTAIKKRTDFVIRDQYGVVVDILGADELLQFVTGKRDIADSHGRVWNCAQEHHEAKPKLKDVYEFIGITYYGPYDKVAVANDILERTADSLPIPNAKDQLIDLLYSQVMDLSMMSKIELGDDVIAEIRRLKQHINEQSR